MGGMLSLMEWTEAHHTMGELMFDRCTGFLMSCRSVELRVSWTFNQFEKRSTKYTAARCQGRGSRHLEPEVVATHVEHEADVRIDPPPRSALE